MTDIGQANTAKRGVSLDACVSKLHNPRDPNSDRCWRILNLSKIKDMKDIPEIQTVKFEDYYDSRRWRYDSYLHPLLLLAAPFSYLRFSHYQKIAKKKHAN